MIGWFRWRANELVLVAVLTVFAVHAHPGWWAAVAFVAFAVGRQEWRTWRLPAEPARVADEADISTERDRMREEERA